MIANLTRVETEVRAALALDGWRVRQLALVSPLGERKGMRYAYRAETDDGRVVKARHFGSVQEAQRVHELRRGLEEAFAPVLCRCGPVLVEAWIEGTMLGATEAESCADTAGVLLGRLHACRRRPDVGEDEDTRRWTAAAAADLILLREAAALDARQGATLRAALLHDDPGRARVGLIHKDFCAENMLLDRQGRLRIIDTELLAIEPIGFDVAWTWHRWPMSPPAWARFMAAYRSALPAEPAAWRYWQIVTGLMLMRIFFQRMPARLDTQRASLLRCLAAAGAEDVSRQ